MRTKINVEYIERYLNESIPPVLAESWDNVGLLVGDREKKVSKILVALDITENVINEAIQNNVDMIVTHHPVIFGGIKKLTKDSCANIYKLIENGISVYSAHTNFDKLETGTSAVLTEKLMLLNKEVLTSNGFGQIGLLKNPMTLRDYAVYIKNTLNLKYVNVVGDLEKMIYTVAVCAGSGSEFMQLAKNKGADLYISGDVTYHNAQRALEVGIGWVDVTHYASEVIAMDNLKKIVEDVVSFYNVEVILSKLNEQPFKIV